MSLPRLGAAALAGLTSLLAFAVVAGTSWVASWYTFPNESLFCDGLVYPSGELCLESGRHAGTALLLIPVVFALATATVVKALGGTWKSAAVLSIVFGLVAPATIYWPEIGLVLAGPFAAVLSLTVFHSDDRTYSRPVAVHLAAFFAPGLIVSILVAIAAETHTVRIVTLILGGIVWTILPAHVAWKRGWETISRSLASPQAAAPYLATILFVVALPFAKFHDEGIPPLSRSIAVTIHNAGETQERWPVTWGQGKTPPPIRALDAAPVSIQITTITESIAQARILYLVAAPENALIRVSYDEAYPDALKVSVDFDGDGHPDAVVPPTHTGSSRGSVDKTAPILTSSVEKFGNEPAHISIHAGDQQHVIAGSSGIAAIYYLIEGRHTAPQPYTGPFEVSIGDQVRYWAIDNEGNQAEGSIRPT